MDYSTIFWLRTFGAVLSFLSLICFLMKCCSGESFTYSNCSDFLTVIKIPQCNQNKYLIQYILMRNSCDVPKRIHRHRRSKPCALLPSGFASQPSYLWQRPGFWFDALDVRATIHIKTCYSTHFKLQKPYSWTYLNVSIHVLTALFFYFCVICFGICWLIFNGNKLLFFFGQNNGVFTVHCLWIPVSTEVKFLMWETAVCAECNMFTGEQFCFLYR